VIDVENETSLHIQRLPKMLQGASTVVTSRRNKVKSSCKLMSVNERFFSFIERSHS